MTVWSLVTPPTSAARVGWAMDGAIDADTLWGQDLYLDHHLAPLSLEFPFVCLYEPDAVYAVLRERHREEHVGAGDRREEEGVEIGRALQ